MIYPWTSVVWAPYRGHISSTIFTPLGCESPLLPDKLFSLEVYLTVTENRIYTHQFHTDKANTFLDHWFNRKKSKLIPFSKRILFVLSLFLRLSTPKKNPDMEWFTQHGFVAIIDSKIFEENILRENVLLWMKSDSLSIILWCKVHTIFWVNPTAGSWYLCRIVMLHPVRGLETTSACCWTHRTWPVNGRNWL